MKLRDCSRKDAEEILASDNLWNPEAHVSQTSTSSYNVPPTKAIEKGDPVYNYLIGERRMDYMSIARWRLRQIDYNKAESGNLLEEMPYLRRNMIFFPIFGKMGELIYYQLRWIDEKIFRNASHWPIGKTYAVHNLWNLANKGIRRCVIVEGIFDVIALDKIGVDGVSLLGTNLSREAEELLIINFDKFYVWLDPDADKHAKDICRQLMRWKPDVTMIKHDLEPDDYVKSLKGEK